jgi:hypothetical protein
MRLRSFAKSKLCDAGFVELAKASFNHAIVLRLGGLRERQEKARSAAEAKSDTGVLSGVRRGEIA